MNNTKNFWVDGAKKVWLRITPDHKALAAATVEFLHSLETKPSLSDYEWNLLALARAGVVDSRTAGIAASAVVAFMRDRDLQVKRQFERQTSNWVGSPKERREFTGLKLVFTRTYESQFGIGEIFKFVDPDGNLLVWFSSSEPRADTGRLQVGSRYNLKATVKSHEERDGVKQTVLTRATAIVYVDTPETLHEQNVRETREKIQAELGKEVRP